MSLKLSDTRVYEPQIRARLRTTAHFCKVAVLKLRAALSCAERTPLTANPIPHAQVQNHIKGVHSLDMDVLPLLVCANYCAPYLTVVRVQVQNHIKGVHACAIHSQPPTLFPSPHPQPPTSSPDRQPYPPSANAEPHQGGARVHSLDVGVLPLRICADHCAPCLTVLRLEVQNHIKGVHGCTPLMWT